MDEHLTKRKLHILDLPRELRDEIYKHYCDLTPRQTGALEGYVDVPSPLALRVCKQFHAELSPIFYAHLKTALLQDRVCLNLTSSLSNQTSRHAGWNVWEHGGKKRFSVWVRNGPTDKDDRPVGWWVHVKRVSPQSVETDGRWRVWDDVFRLNDTLIRFNKVPQIRCWQIRARLWTLQDRVKQVLAAFRKREDERVREGATLKEDDSLADAMREEFARVMTPASMV